jgi:multiple sugar transport system substrate-binding protein
MFEQGAHIMRERIIVLAVALVMAPLGLSAPTFVVFWEKGSNAQEEAAREIIAAFEQETGKKVEIAFYPIEDVPLEADAAFQAGTPPDFAFGLDLNLNFAAWAFEDRLVDLSDAIGTFANMFDAQALESVRLVDGKTGQTGLYGLPTGRSTVHIHVWKNLLERAGYSLTDIPRDWDAFWSFWCDQVQPAARSLVTVGTQGSLVRGITQAPSAPRRRSCQSRCPSSPSSSDRGRTAARLS